MGGNCLVWKDEIIHDERYEEEVESIGLNDIANTLLKDATGSAQYMV